MCVGQYLSGIGSRIRSKCCIQELNLVSDPCPVDEGTVDSSKNNRYCHSDWQYVAQSEIVDFIDEEEGLSVGTIAGNHSESIADFTTTTALADWFKRPVRLDAFVWKGSDPLGLLKTIKPWAVWAATPTITNKLNNYGFFRGDLHIKVVSNASPFLYGRMMMSYLPASSFKNSTVFVDAGQRHLMPLSQRPNTTIDVTDNTGCTMILPFIYPANSMKCNYLNLFQNLGDLSFHAFTSLQSANGVTIPEVPVTIYAWCENIELSGATVAYAAQSETYYAQSDEYGEGCVSAPASAVAGAASYFERFPIIGRFATATRLGATAVSAIAKLFGFTNVPVIADTAPMRPEPFPKLASTEIGFPIEKLTLDPKNELSIDPRIVGNSTGRDEMMISDITSRESYLCSAQWSTSNIENDILFWTRVSPTVWDKYTVNAASTAIYATPMGYIAQAFHNWRGDIIFKFKVVCTQFHKGRLRISFDPSFDVSRTLNTVPDSISVVHTAVLDIGETTEVEFRVPYQQALQFLYCRDTFTDRGWSVNSAMSPYPALEKFDNGALSVRVLNELTAPVASSSVSLLIYVRGAENLEFANPRNVDDLYTMSFYQAQCDDGTSVSAGKVKSDPTDQYHVYFGENIRSLRQLLRRYQYHSLSAHTCLQSANQAMHRCYRYVHRMPESPGYFSNGMNLAQTIVAPSSTYGYNFCQMTYLSYFSNLYLCYRGTTNQTYNVLTSNEYIDCFYAYRRPTFVSSNTGVASVVTNTVNEAARIGTWNAGGSGMAITNTKTTAGLNIQFPSYNLFKFLSTDPTVGNVGSLYESTADDHAVVGFLVKTQPNTPDKQYLMQRYVAAGTDFSLVFFINTPTLFIYSTYPNAA